jgi:membrane-bound lytic murein transglycosylase B
VNPQAGRRDYLIVPAAKVEKDYSVSRFIMLAIWGIESAYGDPDGKTICVQ